MGNHNSLSRGVGAVAGLGVLALVVYYGEGQEEKRRPAPPHDAVADAQTPREVPVERPEQRKSAHDRSDVFAPAKALPSSEALADQAQQGRMEGFDFYRDPLGAMKPGTTFAEVSSAPSATRRRSTWTTRCTTCT